MLNRCYQKLANEWQSIVIALSFLTRLPVRHVPVDSTKDLLRSVSYFPLVGSVIGAIGGGIVIALSQVLPLLLAVVLSIAAIILITGALHEDGFADCCDGFGGGWDKAQILAIMKDPRVGSYGVVGLVVLIVAKVVAIAALPIEYLLLAYIVAHSLSRFMAVSYQCDLDYVSDSTKSKVGIFAKPLPQKLLILSAITVIPWLLFLPLPSALVLVFGVFLLRVYLKRFFQRALGGYTGDCLGMAQQLAEVLIYSLLVATLSI